MIRLKTTLSLALISAAPVLAAPLACNVELDKIFARLGSPHFKGIDTNANSYLENRLASLPLNRRLNVRGTLRTLTFTDERNQPFAASSLKVGWMGAGMRMRVTQYLRDHPYGRLLVGRETETAISLSSGNHPGISYARLATRGIIPGELMAMRQEIAGHEYDFIRATFSASDLAEAQTNLAVPPNPLDINTLRHAGLIDAQGQILVNAFPTRAADPEIEGALSRYFDRYFNEQLVKDLKDVFEKDRSEYAVARANNYSPEQERINQLFRRLAFVGWAAAGAAGWKFLDSLAVPEPAPKPGSAPAQN